MPDSPIDWSAWRGEMHATLMFIVKQGQVLLIEKKRGLGAGKINGPGGKIEPGETPTQAVIRETQEELLVTPVGTRKIGELCFVMSDCPDIFCHVYRADDHEGTPTETDEAVPLWCSVDDIPYHRMWEDDFHWMKMLLSETSFRGRFVFQGESMQWKQITTGHSWDHCPQSTLPHVP